MLVGLVLFFGLVMQFQSASSKPSPFLDELALGKCPMTNVFRF